jgi:hypothetical protein
MTTKQKTNNESSLKSINLTELKDGEKITGYIKNFMKAKNSKFNPDQEHPVLVLKDGSEVVVWAKSTLRTMRKFLAEKNVPMGTLLRLTKTPVSKDYNGKATFFVDIEFKRDDVKSPAELGDNGRSKNAGPDSEGFEY